MGIKKYFIKYIAKVLINNRQFKKETAINLQNKILKNLILTAKHTKFGIDHHFEDIKNYTDFKSKVPIVDYEQLKPYIDLILEGKKDILWPGKPIYLAKTSGTTSGTKYIPLTKDSIPNHFGTARNAVFHYIASTQNADFMEGKMIFLSGSPTLEKKSEILVGRLSGISNHLIPKWLKSNQLPSYQTNCIEEWEEKIDQIVQETKNQDLRLISGIPPWVQMYYEKLLEATGKKNILEIFPNLSMFVYGGVNFEPYRNQLEKLVGKSIPSIETYPASEGFIAYQDKQNEPGLLLNINSGIFFEFIPTETYFSEKPQRISLAEVQMHVNYALVLNTNAGLWGYSIGDTVQFVSLDPYRIIVTGRIKHFISAFGEHVIGKEVEKALMHAMQKHSFSIVEFTVAPQVNPENNEKPYHEWFIEFEESPQNLTEIANTIDLALQEQNIYYQDLIDGNILQSLKVRSLQKDSFRNYMKSQGKLGGQNKVPRLSNDRKIADSLVKFVIYE